jgi:hypothetical protein
MEGLEPTFNRAPTLTCPGETPFAIAPAGAPRRNSEEYAQAAPCAGERGM